MKYSQTLEQLRISGNLRHIPQTDAGIGCIDLSSNDYLGLAAHTELQQQFFADSDNLLTPMTSSASRLLAAHQHEYHALENMLSDLYARKALMFNSGYHANAGAVSALAADSTMILADKLVHASIIDGIVLSHARFTRFSHNDLAHLERLIQRHTQEYERILVVVESVYSMDGDRCDIESLIDLKEKYPNVMLYVDEAHAFGVLGPHGLGLVQASPRRDKVDVIVGTLGKAAASMGAFVAVGNDIREYLVNKSRSFIFSTALPPMVCRWSRYMIETMLEMDAERERLISISSQLATILQQYSSSEITPSHIMPLIIGDASRTVAISEQLMRHGVKVLPIRTPTVPPGTERLRFSLSANLTDADIYHVGEAMSATLS